MILGMSLPTFTLFHVIVSLVAIAAGLVTLFGMWAPGFCFRSRRCCLRTLRA
jgi:hypothetical protein